MPLFPIFIVFFLGSVAETNRAPFDLAEAESELVSGFMTEHAAVIFVFFFLAEYASIILICIFTSILYLGGYLLDLNFLYSIYMYIIEYIDFESYINTISNVTNNNLFSGPLEEGILYGLILGIKTCFMIFVFI
jgi:NADH-ubiquinone oxidoreductase chain 1